MILVLPQHRQDAISNKSVSESYFVISTALAATLLAKQWRKSQPRTELPPTLTVFSLAPKSAAFEAYYDKVQEHLQSLSGMDELLAGLCDSKIYNCSEPLFVCLIFRNA